LWVIYGFGLLKVVLALSTGFLFVLLKVGDIPQNSLSFGEYVDFWDGSLNLTCVALVKEEIAYFLYVFCLIYFLPACL